MQDDNQSNQTQDDNQAGQRQDDNQTQTIPQEEGELKEETTQEPSDLEIANQKIENLTQTAQRALADLANFKRRSEEEKRAFGQFANANLLLEIIPLIDSFERAFSHIPKELEENEWVGGVKNIEQQFTTIIKNQGITPIETKKQTFDPNLHEALLQGPGKKDQIIEELEKGYMLGDKVLRPTKVKVGDGS